MKKILKIFLIMLMIVPFGLALYACTTPDPEIPNPKARIVVNNIVYEAIEGKKEYKCVGYDQEETANELVIPDDIGGVPVTEIITQAFWNQGNIKSVKIGKNVDNIEELAFGYSDNIETIIVSSQNEMFKSENNAIITKKQYMREETTYNQTKNLTEKTQVLNPANSLIVGTKGTTTIPNYIVNIASTAFYGNRVITDVTMPNSLISIGYGAFYNCKKLAEINVDTLSTLKTIGDLAFMNVVTSDVTKLLCPSSLEYIGSKAFANNTALTNIEFGANVKTIGVEAFIGCSALSTINDLTSLKTLGSRAFPKSIGILTLHSGLENLGKQDFAIAYDGLYYVFTSVAKVSILKTDGQWKEEDLYKLSCKGFAGEDRENVVVPAYIANQKVVNVGEQSGILSFRTSSKIKNIEFGDGVDFNINFFDNKTLEKVVFGHLVEDTTDYYNGEEWTLKTLTFGITHLPTKAFSGCLNLTYVYLPSNIESVFINKSGDAEVVNGYSAFFNAGAGLSDKKLTIVHEDSEVAWKSKWISGDEVKITEKYSYVTSTISANIIYGVEKNSQAYNEIFA